MKYDILSLGPARMDLFIELPEDEVNEVCSIDMKRCMIELGFGEKIAVSGMSFAVGGNTGNNAVGLARLGLKAAMVGTMGDGWSDKEAFNILEKEGVDMGYVKKDPGKFGFGAVISYQGERTILSYYPDSASEFPEVPDLDAEWIYLTTAGENYQDFYEKAVSWAEGKGAKIAFNPGTRQLKAGKEKLDFVLRNTNVLFLNREEGARLIDASVENIKPILTGLSSLGPKIVVITDGPAGTYLFDGSRFLYMPIIEAPVVERTGAGDAFGSGFLGAFIRGKSVEECLRWGTVNSASVLGFIGPQKGLLTQEGITEWLKKAEGIVPTDYQGK